MDSKDYSMFHSYSPEYLKDLLENYDEYLQRNSIMDDIQLESKIETQYLKAVQREYQSRLEK